MTSAGTAPGLVPRTVVSHDASPSRWWSRVFRDTSTIYRDRSVDKAFLARSGAAVLMVSSEMPELLQVADRILVMRQGRISGELPKGTTQQEIMRRATLAAHSEESPQ